MYIKSYESVEGQVFTREYRLWNSMRQRVKGTAKRGTTYIGCDISEKFKDFQFFAEWCNNQVGFLNKDERGIFWNLDKDIILKGNKIYCEDCCVFVPGSLNCFLTKTDKLRGKWPVGVDFSKVMHAFRARCSDGFGKTIHIGYFKSSAEAFEAYKIYKEDVAKRLAKFYQGSVDERVVNALSHYTVDAED